MTATHEYGLYGLTLRSNRPLDGLAPAHGGPAVSIDFRGPLEKEPESAPLWTNGFETLWHLSNETWLLRYQDAQRADYDWTLLYEGAERVIVRWDSDELLHDIPAVLQGPGIAASLHLRGVPLLHACVIDVDGGAILVLGGPGAGKSTTAAAMVRSGYAIVSDDLAAMSMEGERVAVQSGFPRLRLFVDSAQAAGWDAASLSRAFVTDRLGDKRYVSLGSDQFSQGPLPVRAIYVLQPRHSNGSQPVIGAIERQRAWPLLAANVYSLRFLDAQRRVRSVADCAAIASRVPMRSVQAGDDLDALPQLVDAIARDAVAVSW